MVKQHIFHMAGTNVLWVSCVTHKTLHCIDSGLTVIRVNTPRIMINVIKVNSSNMRSLVSFVFLKHTLVNLTRFVTLCRAANGERRQTKSVGS